MGINEKMTSIADGLRTLSSTSDPMGLDAMSGHISQANETVDEQSALITQIKRALRGKGTATEGGTGEPAKEEQEVIFPTITENGSYEILPDAGKVMSKAIVNVEVSVESSAGEPTLVYSGKCGATAIWEFYSDGRFVVSGTGDTSDYSSTTQPWSNIKTDVTEVIINEGITSIGAYLCYKFSNVTKITIPKTVTTISNYAFSQCSGLKNIDIPNSVTTIGNSAFYYCSNLTSIIIPNGVTTIQEQAFQYCSSLTHITIPDSVTLMEGHTMRDCKNLTNVIVGNGITNIAYYTFNNCPNLTNIIIPDNVTNIEGNAFRSCSSLASIFYKGTKAQWDLINIVATNNDPLFAATLHCKYEEVAVSETQETTIDITPM